MTSILFLLTLVLISIFNFTVYSLLRETHVYKLELFLLGILLIRVLVRFVLILIFSRLGGHHKILLDVLVALDWIINDITTYMSFFVITFKRWIRDAKRAWVVELLCVLSLRWTLNRGKFLSFFTVIAYTHIFCTSSFLSGWMYIFK